MYLEELYDNLTNKGININKEEIMMTTITKMWESDWFEAKDILKWETRADMVKTCANLKTYFGNVYLQQKNIERATVKSAKYKSANHVKRKDTKKAAVQFLPNHEQITDNTKVQTEQVNQFIQCITTVQEAQQEQTNQTATANKVQAEVSKKQIDAQAEMMLQKATLLKMMSNVPKENERPPLTGQPRQDKHLCKNCGWMVLHKEKNCPEFEENAHMRWSGWKFTKG